MPTTRVLVPPATTAEPVSLALFVAHARIDVDSELLKAYAAGTVPPDTDPALVAQLDLAQLFLSGAREKVEAHTGRYFAEQQVEITYELSEAYELPGGATAVSVTGFFTDLDALAARSAYLEEYRKGISISRELSLAEAFAQTYTVTADVVSDPQFTNLAKRAILEIAAEWYRNRETTSAGSLILSELPVSWRVTLAPAVLNPIGY